MILTVLGFAAALAIAQAPLHAGASHPAFAADGRLVLEIRGDLWLVPDPADPSRRVRLTDGPALDIQPAWTAYGRAVIFASDRSGTFDLWRVEVGEAGAAGDPVRLTRSPAPDREPAVLPDGGIVFVRGRRSEAALWIRDADGTERRLIKAPGEGMDEPALIEFMSRAPEGASLDDVALRSATGAALANVPGTVDGMWRAWKRFGSGRVTWAELLEPAIRLAEEGFALDESFTTTLARERERFLRSEGARALFFPNGRALLPGDTLRNPDLARTLRQIAEGGADAFYRGEIARRIVADLRAHGSPITLHDLARYYAAWREPVRGTYRGHTIYSSAPPVSGGSTLVAQLNLLEHQAASSSPADDAATAHAMIEAWKLIPSTQGRIADPGLWPVDIEPFTSKDTAAQRWLCFDPTRASDPRALEPGGPGCAPAAAADPVSVRGGATGSGAGVATGSGTNVMPSPAWAAEAALPDDPGECDASPPDFALAGCRATGTTSFAVADADGNMVSVTQTLGTWGGNFHVTPGLGFLYNDKLNSYRLEPDGYGARLPNARHGSTIAPTLVFRGTGPDRRPLLAAGAAGNAWITSTVYQVVTAVIDRGLGPQAALEEPRFLLTRQPGPGGERELVVQIEDGYAPDVRRALEAMGHRLQPITFRGELRMGYGAAVVVDRGEARAGGDPRRSGAAGAYSP